MHYRHCLIAISAVTLLSACGEGTVKETLGINRKAPDEFRVVSRPPLSVPPQFNLRPPSYGEASGVQQPAHKQAEALVLGSNPDNTGTAGTASSDFTLQQNGADTAVVPVTASSLGNSSAEAQFLKKAGADKSDPSVRLSLVEEKAQIEQQEEESSWWNIMPSSKEKKEPIVKAKEEAERIKQNKEEGKPVTEGETPETSSKDTGILGRIFGY